MKIIYKGEGGFNSQNINFTPNEKEYDVSIESGLYLTKTFPSLFEKIVEKIIEKVAPKEEQKTEEKPKAVAVKKAK